jgi:hypothetical protein
LTVQIDLPALGALTAILSGMAIFAVWGVGAIVDQKLVKHLDRMHDTYLSRELAKAEYLSKSDARVEFEKRDDRLDEVDKSIVDIFARHDRLTAQIQHNARK